MRKKNWMTFLLCMIFILKVYPQTFKASIAQIDSSRFPEMKIFLSIINDKGDSILGLKKNNFFIFENGNKINNFEVLMVSSKKEWLAIVLALDRSGSMKGVPLREAKGAAKEFLSNMAISDLISLIIFDDKVETISDFSKDRIDLAKKIDLVTTRKDTALYDAILTGLENFKEVNSPRKAMVILTDGIDTASKLNIDKCLDKIKKNTIQIFTIGLGDKVNKAALQKIANYSKGNYFQAPSPEELIEIYRKIAGQLKNQYIIRYDSIADTSKALHRIEVQTNLKGVLIKDWRYFPIPKDITIDNKGEEKKKKTIPDSLPYWLGATGLMLFLIVGFSIKPIRNSGWVTFIILAVLFTILFYLVGLLSTYLLLK